MAYFDHSLLNMLPLHPLWFYSSAYCRWMVLAEHGSSRRWTNPSPYWRDLCAWLPALCAVYFSRHEHDARGVFMSMQRHFRGAAHDGSHHFRVCVQQLTAGTVTEQSQEWLLGWSQQVQRNPFSMLQPLGMFGLHSGELPKGIYGCGTGHNCTTGTAQEGHNCALSSEPVLFQPQMEDQPLLWEDIKKWHAYRGDIFCLCIPTKCMYQSQCPARENRIIKLLTVDFKILFTLQKVQKIKKTL